MHYTSNLRSFYIFGVNVTTAAYLINRILLYSLTIRLHISCYTRKEPDYSHLRVFGCLVYCSTLASTWHKFTARAQPCVFLGYPSNYQGYKMHSLITRSFQISRDVVFYEDYIPFHQIPKFSTNANFFTNVVIP